jgi:ribose 5-phosphate isomerase B
MKIAIGSDHRGVQIKSTLVEALTKMGHTVADAGTNEEASVDYPDIAAKVAAAVSNAVADRGVLICGSGIGMAISANKFDRVRAATCRDDFEAEICRRHNDVNVLCLGADLLGNRNVTQLAQTWLETEFEGGRHERRVNKITELEQDG